jgi:hypothetical protein
MAVAFRCKDGIVIGADRQVTSENNYTFPECKLREAAWKNGRAIWAYSGLTQTAQEFQKRMELQFLPERSISEPEMRNILRAALKGLLRKREQFFTLFGACVNGNDYPTLLVTNGADIPTDVRECEIIGWGDTPLARYLLGTFIGVNRIVTMAQARIYAVWFIALAKKYSGQYVGGPIDVYSVDPDAVRVLDGVESAPWEKEILLVEHQTALAFRYLTSDSIPMEKAIEIYAQAAKRFRDWVTAQK